MEIETVRFDTVEFTVSAYLWLALVEVALGASLAVQLFDFIRRSVEQVTVVCLLVRRGESAKNQDVLV